MGHKHHKATAPSAGSQRSPSSRTITLPAAHGEVQPAQHPAASGAAVHGPGAKTCGQSKPRRHGLWGNAVALFSASIDATAADQCPPMVVSYGGATRYRKQTGASPV